MSVDPNKKMAATLKRANERRAKRISNTLGLYSCRIAEKGSPFGCPFLAYSHELAIKAVYEVCPTLNIYHLGYFHADTGLIESLKKPVIVLDK